MFSIEYERDDEIKLCTYYNCIKLYRSWGDVYLYDANSDMKINVSYYDVKKGINHIASLLCK